MKKGYTLIELLIVITVASILVAGMGTFITKGIDIWAFFKNQNVAQSRSRMAMDRMMRDIRKMRSPAGALIIDPTNIRFEIIEADERINRIGFMRDGNALVYYDQLAASDARYSSSYMTGRTFVDVGITYLKFEIVPTISSLEFSYYGMDASGNPVQAANPTDFNNNGKWIKINLTVQEGNKTFTLATVVALRN